MPIPTETTPHTTLVEEANRLLQRITNADSVEHTKWRVRLSKNQRDALIVNAVAHACEAASTYPTADFWIFVRENCNWVRALDPHCAVNLNTGRRRNFRSPLGELLGLNETIGYGQYCTSYPRTVRSYEAEVHMTQTVDQHVDGLLVAWRILNHGILLVNGDRLLPQKIHDSHYEWNGLGIHAMVRYEHLLLARNPTWARDVARRIGLNENEVV